MMNRLIKNFFCFAIFIPLIALSACSSGDDDSSTEKTYNATRVAGPDVPLHNEPGNEQNPDYSTEYPYITSFCDENETEDAGTSDDEQGEEACDPVKWRIYFPAVEIEVVRATGEISIYPAGGDVILLDKIYAETSQSKVSGYVKTFTSAYTDGDEAIVEGNGESESLGFKVTFSVSDNFALGAKIEAFPARIVQRIEFSARLTDAEAIYGFGQLFDTVNARGTSRKMHLASSDKYGTGMNEEHVSAPFFISSRGYGIFVETRNRGIADCGATDSQRMTFSFYFTPSLDLRFFVAQNPKDIITDYADYTGLPPLPSRWVFGPHHWRNVLEDGAQAIADMKAMRDNKIPGSAIYLDAPWETAYNDFEFNPVMFPDVDTFISEANSMGFEVAAWSVPIINPTDDSSEKAGMNPNTGGLYEEGEEKGYYAKASDGKTFAMPWWHGGPGALVDLTNEDAYNWWKELIKKPVKKGIKGFKLDDGEQMLELLPGKNLGVYFANGENDATMHGYYKILYHKIYAEAVKEIWPEEEYPFLINRTGTWGDQVYATAYWPGDLNCDFGEYGIKAAVRALISLGFVAYPYFGSDIGGFRDGPPTKELLLRWSAVGALSPVMQLGGGGSHEPWDSTFDEETIEIYRKFARLHTDLFPYIYTLANDAHTTGVPIARALFLEYPTDKNVYDVDDEYMFGPDLLSAPILNEGDASKCRIDVKACYYSERTVYFPEGEWFDWWTGERKNGGEEKTIGAYIDELPLYARSGAVIPLTAPDVDTLANTSTTGVVVEDGSLARMRYRLFPSADGISMLYDGSICQLESNDKIKIILQNTPEDRLVVFEVMLKASAGFSFDNVDVNGEPPTEVSSEEELWQNKSPAFYFDDKADILYISATGNSIISVE